MDERKRAVIIPNWLGAPKFGFHRNKNTHRIIELIRGEDKFKSPYFISSFTNLICYLVSYTQKMLQTEDVKAYSFRESAVWWGKNIGNKFCNSKCSYSDQGLVTRQTDDQQIILHPTNNSPIRHINYEILFQSCFFNS